MVIHFAFTALDHHAVDKFHEAALALGAIDNGAPGLRAHYHPTYYAAFALDPDGNNIEKDLQSLEVTALQDNETKMTLGK